MTARNRRELTPWLVLAASLLLTAAATIFTASIARERDRARFSNAVQSAHDRIASRLDVYINTLRGGASLFASSDSVTAEEFRTYVASLELVRRYPGIQGMGWTRRLTSAWPARNAETHAIVYLEPLDRRNRAALGYDMYSENTRRTAMERARDTGEPALSGRVVLVQEIFGPMQPGFLLYVPVYADGVVPGTVAERRVKLMGFVYAPFRANDLFAGIFGSEREPRVSFAVFDGTVTDTASLLHQSPTALQHRPSFTRREIMEVAGRGWTVTYGAEPTFDQSSSGFPTPAVLVGGLLVSAWIFWLALAQAQARLAAETANRAKGDFLATMSHELRTPLNAIGGYIDLLDLGVAGPVNSQQREYLSRVQRAQQHLLGLINNILNFARLESGSVVFQAEPVSLAALIAEAGHFVTPLVHSKNLAFSIEPGPELTVLADPEKLRQVLLNLLSNAVKFTDSHGRITVRWERRGSTVLIHVQDTGIGIPGDKQEQIFDPFVQVDPDLTRTRMGTGLGLAISRELARGMGGALTVQSAPAWGSTFTLRLPVTDALVPAPAPAAGLSQPR